MRRSGHCRIASGAPGVFRPVSRGVSCSCARPQPGRRSHLPGATASGASAPRQRRTRSAYRGPDRGGAAQSRIGGQDASPDPAIAGAGQRGGADRTAARASLAGLFGVQRRQGSRFSPAAIPDASIAPGTWTFCGCSATSSPRHRPVAPRAGWPGRVGGPKIVDRVPFVAGEPGRRGRLAAGFPKRLPSADRCGRTVLFPRGRSVTSERTGNAMARLQPVFPKTQPSRRDKPLDRRKYLPVVQVARGMSVRRTGSSMKAAGMVSGPALTVP